MMIGAAFAPRTVTFCARRRQTHASASAGSFDAHCPALALNTWPGGHQHLRVLWSARPARRATGDDAGAGEPVSTRTAVAARGSAGRWSARRLGFPAPPAARVRVDRESARAARASRGDRAGHLLPALPARVGRHVDAGAQEWIWLGADQVCGVCSAAAAATTRGPAQGRSRPPVLV